MYAIFQSGAHQYVAAINDVVRIEKISAEAGDDVAFEQVVALRNGEDFKVGAPYISGAKVSATVVEQGRGTKIIVFKYRPKKHYKKTMGHRQDYTAVRVSKIEG